MTRVEIIKKAFDYLVFKGVITTRADFADAISYNRTNLSSAMNGNEKYLSDSLMNKISQAFPEFDKNWLLTGEGTMLKTEATMTPYPIEGAAPPILKGVQVTTDGNGVKIITAEPTLKGSRRAVQYAKRLKTQGKPFRFQAASAAPQINTNAVPVLLDPSAPDSRLTVAVPMAKPEGETSQIAQLTAQVDRLIDHLTTSQANISKLVESVEASGKRVDRLLNIIEKKL